MTPSLFLRRMLAADAVASGATGLLLALGAGPLAGPLGLEAAHTRPTGVFFLAYAALVGWMATRPTLRRGAVRMVIAGNLTWAVASLAILPLDLVQPTSLGVAFVVAQALVVGLLAGLQFVGLRRATQP